MANYLDLSIPAPRRLAMLRESAKSSRWVHPMIFDLTP